MSNCCRQRPPLDSFAKEQAQQACHKPEWSKSLQPGQSAYGDESWPSGILAGLHAINFIGDAIARRPGQRPNTVALKTSMGLGEHGFGNERHAQDQRLRLLRVPCAQIEHYCSA